MLRSFPLLPLLSQLVVVVVPLMMDSSNAHVCQFAGAVLCCAVLCCYCPFRCIF